MPSAQLSDFSQKNTLHTHLQMEKQNLLAPPDASVMARPSLYPTPRIMTHHSCPWL